MITTEVSSFPSTHASIDTEALMEVFAAGPARLRKALAGLSPEDMGLEPRKGKWSIKETTLHVIDSELVGAVRFRLVLGQPGIALPWGDQDAWTKTLGHQNADEAAAEEAVGLFELLRSNSLRILRRATRADWEKTGTHYKFGSVTLRQLLELYADHSERHIGQILEMRSMIGKPVKFPLLLQKLY